MVKDGHGREVQFGRLLLRRVEPQLSRRETLENEHLHGIGGRVDEPRELAPLDGREVLEDEVGSVHPAGRPPDAHPDPQVVLSRVRLCGRARWLRVVTC